MSSMMGQLELRRSTRLRNRRATPKSDTKRKKRRNESRSPPTVTLAERRAQRAATAAMPRSPRLMVEISDDDYSAAAAAAGIVPVDGNDEPVSDANSENVPPQNRRSLTPPTARGVLRKATTFREPASDVVVERVDEEPCVARAEAVLSFPFIYADDSLAVSVGGMVTSALRLASPSRRALSGSWVSSALHAKNNDMNFQELRCTRDCPAVMFTDSEGDNGLVEVPFQIMSSKGTIAYVSDVSIKLYSRSVGLLQFIVDVPEVTEDGRRVTVNELIVLINAMRRLTVKADLQVMVNGRPAPFDSITLVERVLATAIGEEGTAWWTDAITDRLFTYVTVHALMGDRINTREMRRKVSYHLATMTRLSTAVDDEFIADYDDKHSYRRFYTADEGGSHLLFSYNGGAALIAYAPGVKDPDVSKAWKGTMRYTRNLLEPILFQRTYLQGLGERLNVLMQARQANNLRSLSTIHGQVLEFNARFGSRTLFNTRSMKEQFLIWSPTVGLDEMKQHLGESIGELHSFFSEITQRETQSRLDVLAVILGMLGLAELIITIITAESPMVPVYVTVGCLVVSIVLVTFMRSRMA